LLLELHIRIDFKEGSSFQYPGFDQSCKVHDTRERTWRHLNFFQYRCYITAKVPRIITPDGKVRTVSVPWARSGSGFTLMMEGVILTLVKHMPVRTVAREIGEHDTKLWRLIDYHVEEALKDQDFSDVSAIGVDEYSHKGHNYITVFLSHPDVATDEAGRCRQAGKARVEKERIIPHVRRKKARRLSSSMLPFPLQQRLLMFLLPEGCRFFDDDATPSPPLRLVQ
jgi:hypothetical protein